MSTAEALHIPSTDEVKLIGKIPVRNLWLLLLYASDLYRQLGSDKISIEDNPEEIADLVAEILCDQVERRLMRNLSFGYENTVATINRVRGRIDILYTERHQLLEKGKVSCRFDELTVDTPRNRYVRAALNCLSTLVSKGDLPHRCRTLTMNLDRLGVKKVKPSGYSKKSERFGRHDIQDQKMIAAADLAFLLALPTEFKGDHHLVMPDKNKEWLRKLFEKGVAGFFAVALDKSKWRVLAGKQFNWKIDHKTDGIDAILPGMRTDIIIENKLTTDRLVIDTKFNSITTSGWHREDTLRSGYIYQMYAYLRSQEAESDEASFNTTGMLLHPSVGIEINEAVTIQGHKIKFCTVDLSDEASAIRQQLLSLIL
ncbi:MAG: 5-methylcytosine-specific restriction endonuclease system specificity protein McrC [Rhodospirillales bacterium]|nr:5-methylcytosine-specific restriction endonuclease system specificity protein McrC [Rhodospirillales bacterium]